MTAHPSAPASPSGQRVPILWAVGGLGLIAVAAMVISAGGIDGIVPYLLSLAGGWMCGYFLVGILLAGGGGKRIVGLVILAGILSVVLWALVGPLAERIAELETMGIAWVLAAQFALPACVGWMWIAVISTITQRARMPRAELAPMEWVQDGGSSALTFAAIPLTLRALGICISGVILAAGLGVVAVAIATDDSLLFAGPRFMIILLGAVIGLPAYLALVYVLRRRQVTVVVDFRSESVILRTDGADRVFDLDDIAELSWGGNGEYSRLLVRTVQGERVSYVAGLAKAPQGLSPALPSLPRPVVRRLEIAGFVERATPTKAGVPVVFTRAN